MNELSKLKNVSETARIGELLTSNGFIRMRDKDYEFGLARKGKRPTLHRIFRYDPQNTGKSPFYFSFEEVNFRKAPEGYDGFTGQIFFRINDSLKKDIQDSVDCVTWDEFLFSDYTEKETIFEFLNKYDETRSFGEKEVRDLVSRIEKVRRMPEFAKICPDFAKHESIHESIEDISNDEIYAMGYDAFVFGEDPSDYEEYENTLWVEGWADAEKDYVQELIRQHEEDEENKFLADDYNELYENIIKEN